MANLIHNSFRQKSSVIFSAFLLTTFIIGVAGALQSPTLSRFLTFDIKASPMFVGLFYSVNAVASIVGSFLLAKYSDRKGDRRNIVIFCCVMGICNSLTFAFTRYYFVLITVGVFFAALASAGMPQIFALAREYAVRTGRNVVAFNSLIRAQLSLAWVIGPPLSFTLVIHYGFTAMYLSGAMMFIISIFFVLFFLPSVAKNPIPLSKSIEDVAKANQPIFKNKNVVFLFLSTVFMWTANMMYLIDMPLYVDSTLHLPDTLPGHLMGLAAGLEIPIMLMSSFLVPQVGKRNLFFIAICSGLIFYSGILLFRNEVALLVLQIFNAIFIGIVANIGIIYFQDLLPTRMGVASTLFNNGVTCGVILAGMFQGIISETYGHHAIYWIAVIMLIISFIFCLFVKPVKE
ncbi:MFS transporter [Orbaceae bacterium ESL0721]|nr:MFS transporter [Orbaceae bacterium ESL0721]